MMRFVILPAMVAADTASPGTTQSIMSAEELAADLPADHEELEKSGAFRDVFADHELGAEKHDNAMWDEQFAEMDTDGDGYLSIEEALNVGMSEEEKDSIKTFVESADEDQDGRVSLAEYKYFADAHEQQSFEEKLQVIENEFKSADKDGDSWVTVEEVETLVGDDVSKDDVMSFFHAADADSNGKLSYDEYVDYAFKNEDSMYDEEEALIPDQEL